jgi:hypothetical protein
MRWPGRRRGAPAPPGALERIPRAAEGPPAPGSTPPAAAAPDPRILRLRRGIALQQIAEHREELGWLGDEIERVAVSTAATGSVVRELASDLDRELQRLRAESAAWARGPAGR